MSVATLINALPTLSNPPYIVSLWRDSNSIPGNSSSSELISLDLPAIGSGPESYLQYPVSILGSNSYIIELMDFRISCDSTSYNVFILNMDDISRINTINKMVEITNINKNYFSTFSKSLIIRNRDITLQSKLYLYIENNDANPTGDIDIEMIYVTLKDRV